MFLPPCVARMELGSKDALLAAVTTMLVVLLAQMLRKSLRKITKIAWTQTKVESMEELMMLTIEVLKAYCGEMDLSKGGTKEQIAERLRKAKIEKRQLAGCFAEIGDP